METKSPVDGKSHRSLLGKVKNFIRSPRGEKFVSDGGEGAETQGVVDIRAEEGDKLSPFTPIGGNLVEGSHRFSWDGSYATQPNVVVHSPQEPIFELSQEYEEHFALPTVRKKGSATIRPSASRPNTAKTARAPSLQDVRAGRHVDTEVQTVGEDAADIPHETLLRISELERTVKQLRDQQAELELENDELHERYQESLREIDRLQIDAMITNNFVDTIKAENRDLLLEITNVMRLTGFDDSGSEAPTRPTSVASSFDAASYLSVWSAAQGAARSPPSVQSFPRTQTRDSASQTGSERKADRNPSPADCAPPQPPRRATAPSISQASISSSTQSRPRPVAQRRDSMQSLRRTSHSHTPTQPSPLALDAMSQTADPEHEHDGEGGEVDGAERQLSKSPSRPQSMYAHGLPTPYSSPSLSRRSTLASSHRLSREVSLNDGASDDEDRS